MEQGDITLCRVVDGTSEHGGRTTETQIRQSILNASHDKRIIPSLLPAGKTLDPRYTDIEDLHLDIIGGI